MRHRHRLPGLGRARLAHRRMTQIYDLSDPAKPVFIRDFGLPGQQPGGDGPPPTGLHGADFHWGPSGNRVYFGYGTGAGGVVQIVDREKLLQRTEGADRRRICSSRRLADSICRRTSAPTPCFRCSACGELPEFGRAHRIGACATSSSITNESIGQRVPRGTADGVDCRHHHRVEAVRRGELDRPRSERQFLRPRRPLRHPLLEREPHARSTTSG